jgi:hypothetical protein
MREIKFRAWNKERKVMFTPEKYDDQEYLMIGIDGELLGVDSCCWDGGCSAYNTWTEGNPWIVMQYTGLKDKNGKGIYEGDVIRYKYLPGKGFWNCDKMHIIKWGSTGFKMEPLPNKGGFNGWLCSLPGAYMPSCQELFEVIGNIYSNPELLEERE